MAEFQEYYRPLMDSDLAAATAELKEALDAAHVTSELTLGDGWLLNCTSNCASSSVELLLSSCKRGG